VRKPYPIPKISTTLQEMEGFSYATALDLNMGYYTIRLDTEAVQGERYAEVAQNTTSESVLECMRNA